MAAEEVDTAAVIQQALLFQCVQDVVGYSRPYVTPEPLTPITFTNNGCTTTIILIYLINNLFKCIYFIDV